MNLSDTKKGATLRFVGIEGGPVDITVGEVEKLGDGSIRIYPAN